MMVLVPAVTDVGLNVAAAPAGKPLAAKATVPVKAPPVVPVAIVNIADWPAGTVCEPAGPASVKSETVKVTAPDVPPPGVGLNTVTDGVPPLAVSLAGTAAVNCVALTNVVVKAAPFH